MSNERRIDRGIDSERSGYIDCKRMHWKYVHTWQSKNLKCIIDCVTLFVHAEFESWEGRCFACINVVHPRAHGKSQVLRRNRVPVREICWVVQRSATPLASKHVHTHKNQTGQGQYGVKVTETAPAGSGTQGRCRPCKVQEFNIIDSYWSRMCSSVHLSVYVCVCVEYNRVSVPRGVATLLLRQSKRALHTRKTTSKQKKLGCRSCLWRLPVPE